MKKRLPILCYTGSRVCDQEKQVSIVGEISGIPRKRLVIRSVQWESGDFSKSNGLYVAACEYVVTIYFAK